MSSPLTRMLLRLYPKGARARFGNELLELQDEVLAHGEISRLGLLRDAVGGALLARSSRQRAAIVLTATAVALAGSLAGLAVAGGHTNTPGSRALLALATRSPDRTPTLTVPPGAMIVPRACFVRAGVASCVDTACTEFVARASSPRPDKLVMILPRAGLHGREPAATSASCAALQARTAHSETVR